MSLEARRRMLQERCILLENALDRVDDQIQKALRRSQSARREIHRRLPHPTPKGAKAIDERVCSMMDECGELSLLSAEATLASMDLRRVHDLALGHRRPFHWDRPVGPDERRFSTVKDGESYRIIDRHQGGRTVEADLTRSTARRKARRLEDGRPEQKGKDTP